MKKLIISIIILSFMNSLYASEDNEVDLFYMKNNNGEVTNITYEPIVEGNFVSVKVKNNTAKVNFDNISKKFGGEGKRPGLAIKFNVSRDGVSDAEGDYMVAAFLNRIKGNLVGGPYTISFSNVNFIFSGKLSINGSPIKGEAHFMQTEEGDRNDWHLGFNEGILDTSDATKGRVYICTEDKHAYQIISNSEDSINQFRVYTKEDNSMCQ